MAKLEWTEKGYSINGQPTYLVSGEFHYFRVPPEDWARRMRLFREAGGNCIATYVPWIVHEPEEGHIVFGDQPKRDLAAFLETAKQEGLMVILRPGPYQYSELVNGGLPRWLIDNYPEIRGVTQTGKLMKEDHVSYLHPLFLEKVRRYYRAFAEVAKPYMASNGGPVYLLQVDNEMGLHIGKDSFDCNAAAMGFGREDGLYPRWLKDRFGNIEALNEVYHTDYASFAEVLPSDGTDNSAIGRRRMRDYGQFYMYTLGIYAATLRSWLHEDGIHEPICHNSPNPVRNSIFVDMVRQMGEGFLLGSDHYYSLNPNWAQNNPTPQYALRMLVSCEMLRNLGMPPTIFELPAGSLSDTPPILSEDLLACYLVNTAMGMKGLNYYIYTGGENFPETGTTGEDYDYHAPVSSDGSLHETYGALKEYGLFLKEHGWMQRAERICSVQVGYCWETSTFLQYEAPVDGFSQQEAWTMLERGVMYSLLAGSCAPEMRELNGALDLEKPLVVVCPACMPAEAQRSIVRFIEDGGRAILMPVLPEWNENGEPCTILKDFVGINHVRTVEHADRHARVENADKVFMLDSVYTADLPDDATEIAWDDRAKCAIGAEMTRGKGKVVWMGAALRQFNLFSQAVMMEQLVLRLGGRETVESSNRNLFTALWNDGSHELLFVMNPYSGRQRSRIRIRRGDSWQDLGEIALNSMEIRPIDL